MFKIFFGSPGAGKTTHAAMVCSKFRKKGIPVYANFPLKGAYMYDIKDLGVYDISDCVLLLDEAGIEVNNRSYRDKSKAISSEMISYLKLARHYGVRDVYIYSQAPDDMDITLRRLAVEFYLLKKSLLPGFSYTKRIVRHIGEIDETTHQIIDGYDYVPFSTRYFFRPKYYKFFDSFAAPELQKKEFQLCE